jgi:outer membrane receptor for ferrienterochelin and colicin
MSVYKRTCSNVKTLLNIHPVVIAFSILLSFPHVSQSEPSELISEIYDMSLEELLRQKVSVSSRFLENELVIGSTATAITKQQWQNFGALEVREAIAHQPGTMIYPTIFAGYGVAIRGYASNLSVRGIATLLDGVPMNNVGNGTALYTSLAFQLPVLDRIEMIRGPGSALYGNDAFHGVLSMSSYSATQNTFETGLTVTSDDGYQGNIALHHNIGVRGDVTIALAGTDQSGLGINYEYTDPSTQQIEQGQRDFQYKAFSGVGKLNLDLADSISAYLNLYRFGHDSIAAPGGGRSFTGVSSLRDRDLTGSQDTIEMFKAGVAKEFDQNIVLGIDAYRWDRKNIYIIDISRLIGVNTRDHRDTRQKGVGISLKQPDNPWNTQWDFAVNYKKEEITRRDSATFGEMIPLSPEVTQPPEGFNRDVVSVSVNAKTYIMDGSWHLIYGGRWDDYSDFDIQTSPHLGVIFQPTPKSSIKLLYGEAFRAPVAAEIFGSSVAKGNTDMEPETIETYELVYLYQTKNWKFNGTIFTSDWEKGIHIVTINDPTFNLGYQNGSENKSKGIELETTGYFRNWRYHLSGSYIDSKANTSSVSVDYEAFPKYIINAEVGYRFTQPKVDIQFTTRIHLDAEESPAISGVPNPEDLSDYYRSDLTLSWDISSNFKLKGSVINIFDRDNYLPSIFNSENGIPDTGVNFRAGFQYQL